MLPTLKPGQDVLVWCWFINPKVGDIVVVNHDGKEMVKRIRLSVDRHIVVMGDNERESTDSRNFGPIERSKIVGKVIFIK